MRIRGLKKDYLDKDLKDSTGITIIVLERHHIFFVPYRKKILGENGWLLLLKCFVNTGIFFFFGRTSMFTFHQSALKTAYNSSFQSAD